MKASWLVSLRKCYSKFCFGSLTLKIMMERNCAYKVGSGLSSGYFFCVVTALRFSSDIYLAFKNRW